MAQIKSDNPLDQKIQANKLELGKLQTKAQAFMTGYKNMPPKDRVREFQAIASTLAKIVQFLSTVPTGQITNAGTRFAFDNLKSSLSSFLGRWKKFERSYVNEMG